MTPGDGSSTRPGNYCSTGRSGALTVGDVMKRAGLARTVFYRHFDRLAQMAPELLPDSEDRSSIRSCVVLRRT